MRPYLAHIRSNLRLMARDRAVLFFSYIFPITLFFLFAQVTGASKDPAAMQIVLTMVVVIGILGSGFFGAGMRTVQDRETDVLRRFKVAPVGPLPMLVSSQVAGVVNFLPMVVMFLLIACLLYGMPMPHNLISLFVFVSLGVLAFRALGGMVGAVVNSSGEAQILVQILYLPMLFLSGATFPIAIMSPWVQIVAGFLPATYVYQGMQAMLVKGESLADVWPAVGALLLTTVVCVFVSSKLFRWEKEEKISGRSKLWVLAVLTPFFLLGAYEGKTKENIKQQKIIAHEMSRDRTMLFTNVRIFVGDGTVIPSGAVLIRNGKIDRVFTTPPTDTKALNAELRDEAGRTLMPGMIDMHVHIGAPGGLYKDSAKYGQTSLQGERLAAYLYCGITAVRSTGDWLDGSLSLRKSAQTSETFGAEYFTYGPLFTAPGGHPTELLSGMPAQARAEGEKQFVRLPNTPVEAAKEVDDLKHVGVDGIKAVLEGGSPLWGQFNHLAPDLYRAVVAEAQKDGLPTATHTGSAADVAEAVAAGSNTIEHGAIQEAIPAETFHAMQAKAIAYDPTLSVYEALSETGQSVPEVFNRSLVLRVVPHDLLEDTKVAWAKRSRKDSSIIDEVEKMQTANLLAAYKAGVTLIPGSDAGNLLVFHGPTVQHELELWVHAGIPAGVALKAATLNAAQYLRAEKRFGSITKGKEATFVLLDGDPVQDITATERISELFFKGEEVARWKLLQRDQQ